MKKPKQQRYSKKNIKKQKKHPSVKRGNKTFRVPKDKMNPLMFLWIAVIMVATYLIYIPSIDNELTNWDDDVYVTDNLYIQKITEETVDVFFSRPFVSNYHPLTMLSYAIDYKYSDFTSDGISPRQFHITNMIFHTLNTGLVFWLIYLLISSFERRNPKQHSRSWKVELAIIVSALFGLHTMHVESVAWIAERKDVLYTFFNLWAFITYIVYLNRKKPFWLVLSILLFGAALLSKAMAVSLAVTLIAIDYLLGRNLKKTKLWLEKVPYLIMALIFGVMAVRAQQESGAMVDTSDKLVFAFYERILFASYGFTQYLLKLGFPYDLSAFYAYPNKVNGHVPLEFWFYPLMPAAFIAGFYFAVKRNLKLIAFGMLFFALNIALVLQLIPVGNAIMADRYTYVPAIGYFLILGVGYKMLIEKNNGLLYPMRILFFVYVGAISYFTYNRMDTWQNSLTMWNDVIDQFQNVPAAYNNRGNALKDRDKFEEAIKDYNAAIKLKPDHYKAYNNRGIAKKNIGVRTKNTDLIREAIEDYDKALRIKKDYDDAYSNRGNAKRLLRDFKGALKDYDKAIELKPMFPQAYSNRAATKIDLKDYEGAIQDLQRSIQLNPRFVEAYYNMANAYFSKRDFDNAIKYYQQALRLRPNYAEAYSNMAGAKFRNGDKIGAINDYEKSVQLKPKPDTYVNMGGTKYNVAIEAEDAGNKAEATKWYKSALADFTTSLEMQPNNSKAFYIRGLCYQKLEQPEKACEDFYEAGKRQHPGGVQAYNKFCLNR